ncbi:MAG TPA: hypothetical protein DHW42_07695 [Candidatus Marinimicrobia bacterium]|nr:hypothetical protein [Candidatus Neomarinimicrobiota bacterium]
MKNILLILILNFSIIYSQTGKVIADSENFRSSPNGDKIGVLLKGTEVKKIQKEGKWVKVTVEGWIYEPSTTFKTNTSLKYSTQTNNDDLQVLYDSGLLKKLDIDQNEAWIDVYIWNSLDYDTKVGIGITLAKICDRAGSTGRITFYDNRSGKKVARYSQSYGYKSY